MNRVHYNWMQTISFIGMCFLLLPAVVNAQVFASQDSVMVAKLNNLMKKKMKKIRLKYKEHKELLLQKRKEAKKHKKPRQYQITKKQIEEIVPDGIRNDSLSYLDFLYYRFEYHHSMEMFQEKYLSLNGLFDQLADTLIAIVINETNHDMERYQAIFMLANNIGTDEAFRFLLNHFDIILSLEPLPANNEDRTCYTALSRLTDEKKWQLFPLILEKLEENLTKPQILTYSNILKNTKQQGVFLLLLDHHQSTTQNEMLAKNLKIMKDYLCKAMQVRSPYCD